MDDLISRQAAIDVERNATVDTNPSHFKAHQKFTQFMDDVEISSFGRWQWSNGFNTALTAVGIDLKKLPSARHWIPSRGKMMDDLISRQAAITLKPCPFCGGEPYFYTKAIGEENGALKFYFRIACRRCQTSPNKAYGDIKIHLLDNGELSISPDDRKKAAEEWNRRTND